jgi:nitric oxide reductase activation protein
LIAPPARVETFPGQLPAGGVTSVANAIESPMRLRRHLTLAVKAPERVAFERHQISGRLDLRNVVGLATGAETVYRRRIEDEAKEAAVTILLDMSSSMNTSGRSLAARAMALHMGDALRAAAVKFEVVAFTTGGGAIVTVPKAFNKPWNDEAKKAIAMLRGYSGTAILPSVSFCAKRLLQQSHVTRRILLVLTDGDDGYPAESNRLNCVNWRRKGIEVIGIGLMVDDMAACQTTFAGHAIYVPNAAQLSEAGIKELVRVLDRGAPRGV